MVTIFTLSIPSKNTSTTPLPEGPNDQIPINIKASKTRLYEALKIQTISYDVDNQNITAFSIWKNFIKTNYNDILSHNQIEHKWFHHAALMIYLKPEPQKVDINNGNPLEFKKLDPVGFLAHSDVVPVKNEKWSVPAFDPELANEMTNDTTFIYGRGTIDMKVTYISLLESLSIYLKSLDDIGQNANICERNFSKRKN